MQKLSGKIGRARNKMAAVFAVAQGAAYDMKRFYRYSGVFRKYRYPAAQTAEITKLYHMIEKGLALPEPRPGFGAWAIAGLGTQLQRAMARGMKADELTLAADALAGYARFNESAGVSTIPSVATTLEHASAAGLERTGTPVIPIEKPDPDSDALLAFIRSRHSVRQYSDADVPDAVLRNAALAAQTAPCVCNRQASKVYFVRDPAMQKALLACQNGNRGFGDTAPVIAVITTNLNEFLEPSERYQPWIDGGLFTMNLLLGIHAQGYGACCLNWSALPAQDRKVRKLGLIPESENIITMMSIGALRENYVVARSGRKAIDQVMRIV